MGQSLRVLDNGSWSTVEAPYIMDGGVWRTVHKVWVMNAGAWQESHKTPYTKYTSGSGGLSDTSTNGTWTVPANTRYINVIIFGHGGGGGGANKTNAYHYVSGAYQWSTTQKSYRYGGEGGDGAYASVILETTPGTVFTWDRMSWDGSYPGTAGGYGTGGDSATYTQNQGGGGTGNLTLQETWGSGLTPPTSVGTYMQAMSGDDGSDIRFYGSSPTNNNSYSLVVGGGKGGTGGKLQVSAISLHPSGGGTYAPLYGYNITETYGVEGAHGTASWSSSGGTGNLIYSNLVTGGGRAGGIGGNNNPSGSSPTDTAPNGVAGTIGSIRIGTYQGI